MSVYVVIARTQYMWEHVSQCEVIGVAQSREGADLLESQAMKRSEVIDVDTTTVEMIP